MAAATLLSAMGAGGEKNIHSFFTRPATIDSEHVTRDYDDTIQRVQDEHDDRGETSDIPNRVPDRAGGKRKANSNAQTGERKKTQKTLGEILNPDAALHEPCPTDESSLDTDGNPGRKKRRRTNEQDVVQEHCGDHHVIQISAEQLAKKGEELHRRSPRVRIPAPPIQAHLDETSLRTSSDAAVPKTPPLKLLRLKANGKFSSPPSQDALGIEAGSAPSKGRNRQRKSPKRNQGRTLIVTLRYGVGNDRASGIGLRIDRIMSGDEIVRTKKIARMPPKTCSPQKPEASKPPHPFFTMGAKKERPAISKRESPVKASAVTPGKLRLQSFSSRHESTDDNTHIFDSALFKDRLMKRHPGARYPPFPSKDNLHVRDDGDQPIERPFTDIVFRSMYERRKHKQIKSTILDDESILAKFAANLTVPKERHLRPDGFYDPDLNLRIPERLLIPGEVIAEKISKELSVSLDHGELSLPSSARIHPSLWTLYSKIPGTITAFDQLQGDALPWTQKYAPATSGDVLQPEDEMTVLRTWLKSLTVQSVQAVIGTGTGPSVAEKPKKPKKRKTDMDDFIVNSDDDVHEMSQLSNEDVHLGTGEAQGSIKENVQSGHKLSNAILLSGPCGCGKTAAAYAVAKELGYRVFEVSSNERRSGKDVLDRIGDLLGNHVVKHHGADEVAEQHTMDGSEQNNAAFQKDLQNGRQGKMNGFLKPQNPKQSSASKASGRKRPKLGQEPIKKPTKDQQQSLILLEEVDILFKEDKDFWTTVQRLIKHSKRPFIMTCNDEGFVPLRDLSFHAILRFCPPPLKLATDYLLLLAAAEGHLLGRDAVATLYMQHRHDLRASITELDLWCQMGVGDPRDGLSWIFQRWPPGSDLDERNRKLRVVSKHTYQQDVGSPDTMFDVEEALVWAWKELDADPLTSIHMTEGSSKSLPRPSKTIHELQRFSAFAEHLSVADELAQYGFLGSRALDPAQLELTDTASIHYVEGMQLLQTDERPDFNDISLKLSVTLAVSAGRVCGFRRDEQSDTGSRVATQHILQTKHSEMLPRGAFACFDAISRVADPSFYGVSQSVFHGPLQTITQDLAPYVRHIVQYDQDLEEQRERLSLLTTDGKRSARARTTRAARSALEGGQRSTTRRERWFSQKLDEAMILATGGKDWPRGFFSLDTASEGGVSKEGTEHSATTHGFEEDEIREV